MNVPLKLRPSGSPLGLDAYKWREAIAARIEALHDAQMALIDALDQMDGDPDREPTGDEEDQSWPENSPGRERSMVAASHEDAEDDDPDEDDGLTEPTLGAPENLDQTAWADGRRGDHGREVDADLEPSLGRLEGRECQTGNQGADTDCEGTENSLGGEPDMEPDDWALPVEAISRQ